ncbi:GNAT family N-acetyltransferase [Streptomyces beijiangensis]|uniref:GNAT family N-acetyltransferase n=1 Tax=Streptomyces beijiangensis TaxID=163361 RepID=A0A939F8H0_9ACTN|nr:GNAT family N-acetyltransferase [Streptomyces beijiangensis]MBO0514551.1 GNAT family N-acetyltransferase [Streptomyces beijiangensis]
MTSLKFRAAGRDDAEGIARLHADSWRRHYRGAYSDEFLDGDVVSNRLTVWASRLATPSASATIVAEDDAGLLLGFVHVVFDEDPQWGSLVDNLHVINARRRTGLGSELLTRAAEAVVGGATGKALYLWVLEQNTSAQGFYQAFGGTCAEEPTTVGAPGGVAARLNGTPKKLRMTWADAATVGRLRPAADR